jgi:hypothetical protein
MITILTGKRVLWGAALATLLLFTLALSGCAKAPKPIGISAPPKPAPTVTSGLPALPSWEDIQSSLKVTMASEKYRQAESLMSKPHKLAAMGSPQWGAYEQRFITDFASSITGPQYTLMQKSLNLPFSALNPGQQNMLTRIAEMFPNQPMRSRIKDSTISFAIIPNREGKRELFLRFASPNGNGIILGVSMII